MNNNFALGFFKGILAALFTALLSVTCCALVLKSIGGANELVLGVINGIIRIAAAGAGCLFYCKKRGLLRGLFMGIVVFFAIYALFGIISGSWQFDGGTFLNFAVTVAAACIFGVAFSSKNKEN